MSRSCPPGPGRDAASRRPRHWIQSPFAVVKVCAGSGAGECRAGILIQRAWRTVAVSASAGVGGMRDRRLSRADSARHCRAAALASRSRPARDRATTRATAAGTCADLAIASWARRRGPGRGKGGTEPSSPVRLSTTTPMVMTAIPQAAARTGPTSGGGAGLRARPDQVCGAPPQLDRDLLTGGGVVRFIGSPVRGGRAGRAGGGVARESRDFTVPSATPSTTAASAKGVPPSRRARRSRAREPEVPTGPAGPLDMLLGVHPRGDGLGVVRMVQGMPAG